MAHLIEENIDTMYAPNTELWKHMWHNMQTYPTDGQEIKLDLSNVPDCFCPIIEGKAMPNFGEDVKLDEQMQKDIESWKILAADCRQGKSGRIHPLHIPKDSYTIHQNKELAVSMVKSALNVLGCNNFEIVSIGTLGGYREFIISIAIKGSEQFTIGENDNWKRFFNLCSSHAGNATARMLSFIRIVCWNTLNASYNQANNAGTLQNISHTKGSLELITPESFERDLKAWIDSAEHYKKLLTDMKNTSMSLSQFQAFACGVFTDDTSDKVSTTSYNRITELENLFSFGDGNSGQSRYDAVNAFTDYFTRGNGAGKKNGAKKMARANFGRGNDWKLEAIRILSDETEFNEASKRGERLLHDRALLAKAN